MVKMLKYFLYIIIAVLALFVLVKTFTGSSPNSANAFEWEKQVNVYFVDLKKAETSSCEADVAIQRTILNAETFGPGAIEALIKGVTPDEEKLYYSAINKGTLLQRFEIKNRVAYVDFNSSLNQDVAGSCNVIAIRSQIENTLNNLPDIDSVVISVNGQTEGILEP